MTEEELLGLAAAGEERAQRALYDLYSERIYRLSCRMTGDAALAEDLTQEVFIRAFSRLSSFAGRSSFATWLHQVAVSVILNGLRRVRKARARETTIPDTLVSPATDPIPPDLLARLQEGLQALPAELRLVLVMFDAEGYTHEEIAATLGISSGACRMRLLRARAQMRGYLSMFRGEWES